MEEITQIIENIMAKLRNRNIKNSEFNIEQASADTTGGATDKCTQTSNECYIFLSVSQSEDGYSYTTWKVLLDTDNVFEMERKTSQRETSTQTENSTMSENHITIDDDYTMSEVFDDTSEWSEFIDDKIKNKTKTVDNSKRQKKKRRNIRNRNWRRRDICGDPNNNSYNTSMTNDNQFSDRNRDREIFGFHDSETLILSMDDFGNNLANMPYCETLDTDIATHNVGKCYLDCTCESDNYYMEDIESNIFSSNLNEMDLNKRAKSEDLNTQNMYEVIHVSEESQSSDDLNKEVTGPDFDKTEQIMTVKPMKKITLEEYRRRLAEKANASTDNVDEQHSSKKR